VGRIIEGRETIAIYKPDLASYGPKLEHLTFVHKP